MWEQCLGKLPHPSLELEAEPGDDAPPPYTVLPGNTVRTSVRSGNGSASQRQEGRLQASGREAGPASARVLLARLQCREQALASAERLRHAEAVQRLSCQAQCT